jgi:hypothetical protein
VCVCVCVGVLCQSVGSQAKQVCAFVTKSQAERFARMRLIELVWSDVCEAGCVHACVLVCVL